jgi:hypothetical protein
MLGQIRLEIAEARRQLDEGDPKRLHEQSLAADGRGRRAGQGADGRRVEGFNEIDRL